MLKTLLLVAAGLGAGLAIALWFPPAAPALRSGDEARVAPASPVAATTGTANAGSAQRLEDLERALAAEVEQRAALEARVVELATALEELRSGAAAAGEVAATAAAGEEPRPRSRGAAAFREARQARQAERLIAAGFPPDRAEWIDRRVEELRMEVMQAEYDARREGRPFDPTAALAGDRTLRSELGDTDYERYLQAVGRPTSVAVQDVLGSSPAERSGLLPGDEVVSYDGERVFDMRELNALTLEGNAGESVVVEVRRNGQAVQVVMPRGPLGIFGGSFRGR